MKRIAIVIAQAILINVVLFGIIQSVRITSQNLLGSVMYRLVYFFPLCFVFLLVLFSAEKFTFFKNIIRFFSANIAGIVSALIYICLFFIPAMDIDEEKDLFLFLNVLFIAGSIFLTSKFKKIADARAHW